MEHVRQKKHFFSRMSSNSAELGAQADSLRCVNEIGEVKVTLAEAASRGRRAARCRSGSAGSPHPSRSTVYFQKSPNQKAGEPFSHFYVAHRLESSMK